jgi:hypothetical protein
MRFVVQYMVQCRPSRLYITSGSQQPGLLQLHYLAPGSRGSVCVASLDQACIEVLTQSELLRSTVQYSTSMV